jgi:signal transduction histidine kinase
VMGKAGRRRGFKSWFVEPYKQVRLGLMFVLVNIIFAALILGVFGYYVLDIYRTVAMYFKMTDQESLMTLGKFGLPVVVGTLLIVLFVVTTIMVSVKYTHTIYGPLVSIHRFLDDLLEGRRPSMIQLRESDQLRELAQKLNQLTERVFLDPRSGAMTAMHRYLDELVKGNCQEDLHLREGDNLQELASKINQLAASMRKRQSEKR